MSKKSEGDVVMVCKLQLHDVHEHYFPSPLYPVSAKVTMGGVWEGSEEAQVASENAIFGRMSPQVTFDAVIKNPDVVERLRNMKGKKFYVTFTEAPD